METLDLGGGLLDERLPLRSDRGPQRFGRAQRVFVAA
jgi:hypothetical protein